jgi:hypothetical protein
MARVESCVRRAARTDDNHAEVRDYLRANGWSVHDTHALGGGFLDLACSRFPITVLLEVKDGSKPPSRHALTPDEQDFVDEWDGLWAVVLTKEDALATLETFYKLYGTKASV